MGLREDDLTAACDWRNLESACVRTFTEIDRDSVLVIDTQLNAGTEWLVQHPAAREILIETIKDHWSNATRLSKLEFPFSDHYVCVSYVRFRKRTRDGKLRKRGEHLFDKE